MFLLYLLLACVGAVLVVMVLCVLLYYRLKFVQLPKYRVDSFISRARAAPLAHRGGRPENTLAAIIKSHQLGASGVEVDLAFTKDGEPVLLHDRRVDRTSNGSGRVQNMTLSELKKLDFGIKTGGPGCGGVQIPTLYEAIELCEKLDLMMFLEIKGNSSKAIPLLKRIFSDKPALYSRIAVISFYPSILYRMRRQDKNLMVGLVTRTNVLSTNVDGSRRNEEAWKQALAVCLDQALTWSINTWIWRILGISLLLANKNDILSGRVCPPVWEQRGISLVGWTVNSIQEKNHFKYLLKMPFMSDHVAWHKSAPEQKC